MFKKIIIASALMLLSASLAADENAEYKKYRFKFYMLIKGIEAKNFKKPNFGYRILKTFPLRVKEFTFPARYLDFKSDTIKNEADPLITENIAEWRRKNAYHISNSIYEYISKNIEDRRIVEEPEINPHRIYYSGLKVFREKKGNVLEKCRLAVTMLRYYTIPARIIYRRDTYAVEYFMRPLEGKSGWFIMDFTGEYDTEEEYIEPVSWNPLEAKELLNEEWDGERLFLKVNGVKNKYLEYGDADADSAFNALTEKGEWPDGKEKPGKKYYLIKEVEYEIWLRPGRKEAVEVEFMLPFNYRDTFKKGLNRGTLKTMRYFVKPETGSLKVEYKRAHTRINPPQRGMIYSLPVKFRIDD